MKLICTIIQLFFLQVCFGQYHVLDEQYKRKFTTEVCKDASVFFTACFQTYGFDFNEIDTVTIVSFTKNSKFRASIDSYVVYLTPEDLFSNTSLGDDITSRLPTMGEELINLIKNDPSKTFVFNRAQLVCSKDYLVKFGSKYVFKITGMESRKMYVNYQKKIKVCGLYSYQINGLRRYFHNLILIKPNTKIIDLPGHYIQNDSIFVSDKRTDSTYIDDMNFYDSYHHF